MEAQEAQRIVRVLLQGVDPRSGQILPRDNVLHDATVIRALLAAIDALEHQAVRSRRRARLPANLGRAWSGEEEQTLLAAFDRQEPLERIAAAHGRSLGAIESRLQRLGCITAEQRKTRGRF
jgi:hypothetical protein